MSWADRLQWLCPSRWPWCHRIRAADRSNEAQDKIDSLETRGDEIREVGAALRAESKRNNFGPMVEEAIRGRPRRAHG